MKGVTRKREKTAPALDIPLKGHDWAVYGLKVPTGALSVKTISGSTSISSPEGQLRVSQTSGLDLDIGAFMPNFS